jgi:putative ABC transport system permease protein
MFAFTKLVFKNAFRHKLRSALTIAGIAIAVLAFGLLRTVIAAWYAGVEASAPNRLIVRNAVSFTFPLPLSYKNGIVAVPGVDGVTYALWFGGIYIDERNFFPQFAIDPTTWFDIYPEFRLPPEQKTAFVRERNAAVVGVKVAERYGWKLGDTVRLRGTFFPGDWDFVIRGIYTGANRSTDQTAFMFHWEYINEQIRKSEPDRAGHVGWYVVKVADPEASGAISQTVDQRFQNSLAETKTETEKAFQQGFVAMTGAILTALKVISIVIIGVILAVLSNTMAMTARERLSEYAVLKTLGFGAPHLIYLIAGESLLIALLGGGLGIVLMYPAAGAFGKAMENFLPIFEVKSVTLVAAAAIAAGVGVVAALFPSWRAVNVNIVEGIRRIG